MAAMVQVTGVCVTVCASVCVCGGGCVCGCVCMYKCMNVYVWFSSVIVSVCLYREDCRLIIK